MSKVKKETIEAKGFAIQIYTEDFQNDYISLTDIARYKSDEPSDVIKNWMRRKDTIEFLGLWESLNNMNFNSVEFDRIKSEAGYNSFTLSPKKSELSQKEEDTVVHLHIQILPLNLLHGFLLNLRCM